MNIKAQGRERTRIGVGQHGTDRKEDFRNGECGRPLITQNVQTDTAVAVDVGMINARREVNLCTHT